MNIRECIEYLAREKSDIHIEWNPTDREFYVEVDFNYETYAAKDRSLNMALSAVIDEIKTEEKRKESKP